MNAAVLDRPAFAVAHDSTRATILPAVGETYTVESPTGPAILTVTDLDITPREDARGRIHRVATAHRAETDTYETLLIYPF